MNKLEEIKQRAEKWEKDWLSSDDIAHAREDIPWLIAELEKTEIIKRAAEVKAKFAIENFKDLQKQIEDTPKKRIEDLLDV